MTLYQIIADSPYLTFFAIVVVCEVPMQIVRLLVRSRNIKHHGWPPPHCDADGDIRTETDSES